MTNKELLALIAIVLFAGHATLVEIRLDMHMKMIDTIVRTLNIFTGHGLEE